MKNIIQIYKIIMKHWGFMLLGLISMLFYALLSGVSIMMAIPLLDYVFKSDPANVSITKFPEFWQLLSNFLSNVFTKHSIFSLTDRELLVSSLNDLKEILVRTDPQLLLWMICLALLIIVIFKNLFFFCQRIFFASLRGRAIRDIRDQIYHKYLFQSLAFFNRNKVGDSIVRMVSDVDIVNNFFVNSLFNSLHSFILLLVYARIALFLNLRLFLISLFLLPFFSIAIHLLGNKIKKYSQRIQEQTSNMFSNVNEKLNGIRIVKSFSRENFEMDKFKAINERHFRYWFRAKFYDTLNIPLSELNTTITGLIVLMLGVSEVLIQNSSFSFGSFITFILAIFSMLYPIKTITRAYAGIRKALVSLNRIFEILNRGSEITQTSDQLEKGSFVKDIKFVNVGFSYNEQTEVLRNINLTINKGEKVALVGSSGSGKTTLVNLLERMYDTSRGKILIDDLPIKMIKLLELRKLFGTVTQESILFADTIAANISYGTLREVTEQEIVKAAKIANATEFIDRFPDKYKTMLNPRGNNLSGGQRQRLCIARAIVGDPSILIFDEATSSLDSESEIKVQQAIEKATQNRTVIVIAHRLSTILASDKIVVIEDGQILDVGTHKKLLKSNQKYKTLYELQFKGA